MTRYWLACAVTVTVAATAVAGSATAQVRPVDLETTQVSPPTVTEAYGPAPQQVGDLRLPAGKGPFPVVVVIHGGCWTKGFATRAGTAPVADALAKRGVATWNVEYRQVGDPGGGWPGSFQDWGAGLDHLRVLARRYPIDLTRVVVAGHSAGAFAALWAASRPRLAKASPVRGPNPLRVRAAVVIDGPGEVAPFIGADQAICGAPVITNLMGGTPADHSDRYRDASPAEHLPLGVPSWWLGASPVQTPQMAEDYARVARAKGDRVEVIRVSGGGHFGLIAPGQPQWPQTEAAILQAVGR